MSFLNTLRSAFKGGGGSHVPLARNFTSPWYWAQDPAGTHPPFDYRRDVTRAFLDNPVAQRAVRIVSESVGSVPLQPLSAFWSTLSRAPALPAVRSSAARSAISILGILRTSWNLPSSTTNRDW